VFISITFRGTSIDETNKKQQKVRGSKFMTMDWNDILEMSCVT